VLTPALEPAPTPEPTAQLPAEVQALDSVLAARAPGLEAALRQQLALAISEEAGKAGYDPMLVLAIIDVESDFEQGAVSPVGAQGLMQIQPATLAFIAHKQGIELSHQEIAADPALCVRLGIRYLKQLQDTFGGNLDLALMAYNAGPGRISVAARDGELDAYRGYPRAVRRDFRRFREGAGLGGEWDQAQHR
jgi:soluble lytic murein transglycosylase